MIPILKLTSIEKGSAGIRLSHPLPDTYVPYWIHLPSLSRVRLKPSRRRNADPEIVRFKGLGRERLKRGDIFLPLNAPLICSRCFYGHLEGIKPPADGVLTINGRQVDYRIRAAESSDGLVAKMELLAPLALKPAEPLELPGGRFTPQTTSLWREISASTPPLEAQGWLPAALPGDGISSGTFRFHSAWLQQATENLQTAARREGGLDAKRISGLLSVPPYLQAELIALFEQRGEFRLHRGILLDAAWDYSTSLSPMGRGLLEELRQDGIIIEKIPGSPRFRGFSLLVRTGLAEQIEDGVFVEEKFLTTIYRQVASIRQREPESSLSDLAERTGVKKRLLIPLLQYGDTEL